MGSEVDAAKAKVLQDRKLIPEEIFSASVRVQKPKSNSGFKSLKCSKMMNCSQAQGASSCDSQTTSPRKAIGTLESS
jgi:hypothetical protein